MLFKVWKEKATRLYGVGSRLSQRLPAHTEPKQHYTLPSLVGRDLLYNPVFTNSFLFLATESSMLHELVPFLFYKLIRYHCGKKVQPYCTVCRRRPLGDVPSAHTKLVPATWPYPRVQRGRSSKVHQQMLRAHIVPLGPRGC